MKKILVMGAGSAIAEATARVFAQRGDALFLVGRKADVLESMAADLRVRGAQAVGLQAALYSTWENFSAADYGLPVFSEGAARRQ